jgi:hypothetical protein
MTLEYRVLEAASASPVTPGILGPDLAENRPAGDARRLQRNRSPPCWAGMPAQVFRADGGALSPRRCRTSLPSQGHAGDGIFVTRFGP